VTATKTFGPGLIAPALFLATLASPLPALAQVPPPAAPLPSSNVPIPGELELAKLIWSTMAAVDHANQAGNYSVLRDLAAPGFQVNNDSARLAAIFASLRATRVDLSNTLLLAPTYTATPRFVEPGILQVRGLFGLRPTAISFELYYQWTGGKWKLFGVSISPLQIAAQQPGPAAPPPVQSPAKRK
jgi:hypothetical protein